MNLGEIGTAIKDHVEQGEAWFSKIVEEHVPALLAEAERLQSNTVVQALEGLVFPPEVEAELVNIIKAFAAVLAKVPGPAAAEPAVEPAADDQAPGHDEAAEPSAS